VGNPSAGGVVGIGNGYVPVGRGNCSDEQTDGAVEVDDEKFEGNGI